MIDKPKPYARILGLGNERVTEMKRMLRTGSSVMEVVRVIREEWNECLDISEASLQRQVARWRKKRVMPEVKEDILKEVDNVFKTAKNLDLISEYDDLLERQKARLMKVASKEEKSPMLLGVVTKEIQVFQSLLKDVAQLHLETGLLKRAPKTITGMIAGEILEEQTRGAVMFRLTEEVEQRLKQVDDKYFGNSGPGGNEEVVQGSGSGQPAPVPKLEKPSDK